jgi:lysine biosynthesis protein LysW
VIDAIAREPWMAVTCPECDAELDVDEFDVEEDEEVSCPECGSTLRVVTTSPLELEALDDDDDEDDDEDDKDEDEDDDDEDVDDEDETGDEDDKEDWEK